MAPEVTNTDHPQKEKGEKLSSKEKTSYGFGGFVDQIMANSFGLLSFPIYNIPLGLDAKLLGMALAVPRFVDAITDPLMGHISDNFFHLRPGAPRTITVTPEETLTQDELIDQLRVRSLVDTYRNT